MFIFYRTHLNTSTPFLQNPSGRLLLYLLHKWMPILIYSLDFSKWFYQSKGIFKYFKIVHEKLDFYLILRNDLRSKISTFLQRNYEISLFIWKKVYSYRKIVVYFFSSVWNKTCVTAQSSGIYSIFPQSDDLYRSFEGHVFILIINGIVIMNNFDLTL